MAIAPTTTPVTTKRSVAAATEYLLTHKEAPGIYLVDNGKQGDDHDQYRVDMREPACSCADYQYRADSNERVAEHGCKHVRRVRMEQGEIDIEPLRQTDLRLDPLLIDAVEDEDDSD